MHNTLTKHKRRLTRHTEGLVANSIGSFSGFMVDLSLLWVLLNVAHLQYLLASALAFLVGASVHFSIARVYAFPNSTRTKRESYLIFLFVSLIDILLLAILMFVAVDILSMAVLPSRIAISVIIGLTSFVLHKHITFACTSPETEPHHPNGGEIKREV